MLSRCFHMQTITKRRYQLVLAVNANSNYGGILIAFSTSHWNAVTSDVTLFPAPNSDLGSKWAAPLDWTSETP